MAQKKTGKYILTHGIPGCGKSTWARQQVEADKTGNTMEVNRDDIRTALFGASYHTKNPDKKKEQEVTQMQMALTKQLLAEGKTVINSDTNLNPRFLPGHKQMASDYGAEFEQKSFNVDPDECRRRNLARARVVPEHVMDRFINDAYDSENNLKEVIIGDAQALLYSAVDSEGAQEVAAFNAEMEEKYPRQMDGVSVNFDMDGTLADMRASSDKRMFTGNGNKRNFLGFFRDGEFAPPNDDVLQMALEARERGMTVTVTTARSEEWASATLNWLRNHEVPVTHVFMRKAGDFRKDYEVKRDILLQARAEGFDFAHCVDDNPQAVRAWQEAGIQTTVVPFHTPQEYDENRVYPVQRIASPFGSGFCVRCGQPIKEGYIGSTCRKRVG